MVTDIEDADFVEGSIEDLNDVADSIAREILAVRDRQAGELRDALLDALRDVEHSIRVRTTELAAILSVRARTSALTAILSARCGTGYDEAETILRTRDIAEYGVLYR